MGLALISRGRCGRGDLSRGRCGRGFLSLQGVVGVPLVYLEGTVAWAGVGGGAARRAHSSQQWEVGLMGALTLV